MRVAKVNNGAPEVADRFDRVLSATVEALEEAKVKYLFIGGIASGGLGRPRTTHDIDVFVRPEDAETALRSLARRGFKIEKTDPNWLFKGYKENVLVDVIFKSKGEIYLDTEMYQKMTTAEFHGKRLRLVAPEDLVIIKAIAHSEVTPGHWHDALAVLSHATIDWDYLVKRARRAPRRVLSLLLYAQSVDVHIPKQAIDQLYTVIFGDIAPGAAPVMHGRTPLRVVPRTHGDYRIARLRERFAQDPHIGGLDIQVEMADNKVFLRGDVMTQERADAIVQVAQEIFPDFQVENHLRLVRVKEPSEIEEIR
jgi:predicted nucleotidyltransferase